MTAGSILPFTSQVQPSAPSTHAVVRSVLWTMPHAPLLYAPQIDRFLWLLPCDFP